MSDLEQAKNTQTQEPLRKRNISIEKHILGWTIAGTIGTWFGAIAVIGGAIFITETVQDVYNKAGISILIPPANSTVPDSAVLSGYSNMRGFNHYVIVTDVPYRKHYVQDGPMPIAASGLWSQPIPFGEPGKNCGTQFSVLGVWSRDEVVRVDLKR